MYQVEKGDFSAALVGEIMPNQSLTVFQEKSFLALRDILRLTDITFGNAETTFHNYEDSPGYWAGTYMRTDPALIKDIQWLGIDIVSCANNHAYDFGENGVMTNLRYLDQTGLTHAGTGPHLAA